MKTEKIKQFLLTEGKTIFFILLGCALVGASFSFLTFPNNIVSGGITGIAQILNLLVGFPVGIAIMIMNVPLFVIAWKKFGLRFIIYSLIGTVGTSVAIDIFNMFHLTLTHDTLLAAVYGGLVSGAGSSLIYTVGATGGGTDIVSRLVRRKYGYMQLGTISLVLNAVVVTAFAIIFHRFDAAMYTIITMFVSSRIVNLVLYGSANSSICYIITSEPHRIAHTIGENLGRGATILKGEGAYTGEEKDVVLCAAKRHQIPLLKKLVSDLDHNAFVIVTQSHEVFGKNFQDILKSQA